MNRERLEKFSSAVTLSDMEVFIFPELLYSLVLANIMSPVLWRWRDDPWFAGLGRMKPYRKIQRLRQYIMDHYVFNLDLETWGLTTRERELKRFEGVIDAAALAQSNALFGYEGDKYYFDIDIRTHFGLDKYTTETIPYWKTETVEAMDAFQFRAGYQSGAGECVSLAALYAAALFIVCGIPLEKIFMLATPLHSQVFVDIEDGILINNRRLVTKTMWFNGSALSGQARRALENERVTIVSHCTGHIHAFYDRATIDAGQYERLQSLLRAFLRTDLTPDILGNFLRQNTECQRCFVLRHPLHGVDHYIPLERVFAYEQGSPNRLTGNTRERLLDEIEQEELTHTYCPGKIVFNDVEDAIRNARISFDDPASVEQLKRAVHCSCLNAENAIDNLIRFCRLEPRLPDPATRVFDGKEPPICLTPGMDRDAVVKALAALRSENSMAELAFYVFRDLGSTEALPFLVAALQRNPVALEQTAEMEESALCSAVMALAPDSIYAEPARLAQPDEVWNFQRGDGLERVLLLALLLRERRRDPALRIELRDGTATLSDATGVLASLPSTKTTRETCWDLGGIVLCSE